MDEITSIDHQDDVIAAKEQANYDAAQLANITGYEQQMVRRWSLQKVIGMGLGLASTWAFAGAGLTLSVAEGGPTSAIWGFVLVSIFTFCVSASIAELASAYPTTGGPFYWTARLAPAKYASFLSMMTGTANCMSWICACATVASTNAQQIFGFVVIMYPDFEIQRWMLYILFLFFMFFGMLITMFLYPVVPIINKYLIYWSQTAMLISIIMMLVRSGGQFQSNHFVWTEFVNETGWDDVICFLTGLINGGFQYGHLDASVHLAEEASRPERSIPIAIAAQVGVSFPQGFIFQIVMFYCIKDLTAIMNSTIPTAELYLQAMNYSKPGAVILQLLTVSILVCVNLEVQTTASRLVWSFARDKALPFSTWLGKVHPKLLVPVNAQLVVNCIVFILGFLYLFAKEAYSALVGSSFILAYTAYFIPIAVMVLSGRKFTPGPFHMKGYGMIVNIISLGWLIVGIVFWEFPFFMPVVGQLANMNWTVVVVAGIMLLASIWFLLEGHKHFKISVGLRDLEPAVEGRPTESPVPEQPTEPTMEKMK